MARLRKGVTCRRMKRPYVRLSKFKSKGFIKMTYNPRITKFVMGNLQKENDYECTIRLLSKGELQIRDNAMESARLTSNRLLEKNLGPMGFFMRVNKYPYQVIRMHALASGAGADRFSTGMAHAFGKPIGQAIQVKPGQALMEIKIDRKNLELAKKAMVRASQKLPCSCTIQIEEKALAKAN
jgi:large subunit ribosomal protein L10e